MVIHPTLYPTQSPHKAYTHTHTHTHKSKLPGALTPLRKTKGSCVRERERDREREFVCVCVHLCFAETLVLNFFFVNFDIFFFYKLQVFYLSDAQNDTGSDWALKFL